MTATGFLLSTIALPVGILLVFLFASKYPQRLQSWIPWAYGISAILSLPRIYFGFARDEYGVRFWLSVATLFLLLLLIVVHARQRDAAA